MLEHLGHVLRFEHTEHVLWILEWGQVICACCAPRSSRGALAHAPGGCSRSRTNVLGVFVARTWPHGGTKER